MSTSASSGQQSHFAEQAECFRNKLNQYLAASGGRDGDLIECTRPISFEGEFGAVYEGTWKQRSKPTHRVALKITHLDHNKAEQLINLRNESDSNFNVVQIYRADFCLLGPDPRMYIVMELWHSISLEKFLSNNKAQDLEPKLTNYANQTLCGLQFLHGHDIVHGDLRPAHILVSHAKQHLKLSGFGLTRSSRNDYDAPEGGCSKKGDVYSAGLILTEMWSGVPPSQIHKFGLSKLGRMSTDLIEPMLRHDRRERCSIDVAYNQLSLVEVSITENSASVRNGDEEQALPTRGLTRHEPAELLNAAMPTTSSAAPFKPVEVHHYHPDEKRMWDEIKRTNPDCKKLSDQICYFKKRRLVNGKPVFYGAMIHATKKIDIVVKFIELDRGENEVTSLMRLVHPNIVRYLWCHFVTYKEKQHYCVVTEKCHPKSFRELPQINRLSWEYKKRVMAHLASGMEYIHGKNILHRDLKPDNILLSEDWKHARIADFGYSKKILEAVALASQTSDRCGSMGYQPPEFFAEEKKVSKKSDIYQLGLVFFHVLSSGEHIFGDEDDQRYFLCRNCLKTKKEFGKIKTPDQKLTEHLVLSMLRANPHDECLTDEQEQKLTDKIKEKRITMDSKDKDFDDQPRPTATEVLRHPYFWKLEKKLRFCKELLERLESLGRNEQNGPFPNKSMENYWQKSIRSSFPKLQKPDMKNVFEQADKASENRQWYPLQFVKFLWEYFRNDWKNRKSDCEKAWQEFNALFPDFFLHAYLYVKTDNHLSTWVDFCLDQKWEYEELEPLVRPRASQTTNLDGNSGN